MSKISNRLYGAAKWHVDAPNDSNSLANLKNAVRNYDEEQVALTGLFTAVAMVALFMVLPAAIGFMMLGVWTDFRWFWTGMIMAPAALVMFAIGAIGTYERQTRRTE